MGEAFSDFLALRYGPVLAGVVGTLVFAVALVLQFRARRYRVWTYWFAVAMVAVWGTLAADGLHIKLGVPSAPPVASRQPPGSARRLRLRHPRQ